MKIELIATLCVLGVGVLLGVGFSTDGGWLDTADKIASVVSCVVTCVAFVYALKAYHSWKTPLLVSAIEEVIIRFETANKAIYSSMLSLSMAVEMIKMLSSVGGARDLKQDTEFLQSHAQNVLDELNNVSINIPSNTLAKIKRFAPDVYQDLSKFSETIKPVSRKFRDALNYTMYGEQVTLENNDAHLAIIEKEISQHMGLLSKLEESLKESLQRTLLYT